MTAPVKHLLVYADGRVEDAGQALVGRFFIKPENVNGDYWQRTFEVQMAHDGQRGGPDQSPKTCSMVAIEREFRMTKTRDEIARDDAERRDRTMKECLWGIENYPSDPVPGSSSAG